MERLRRDVKGLTRLAMVPLIIAVAVISSVCTYFAVPPKERVVEVPVVERLRAAWVYIGPIGDYGWTYAHNLGREYADERLQWLETKYLEAIPYADAPRILDELVAEGYEVIFTTSFGYMDPTIEAGNRHPDVIFMHCSGYKRSKNVGTYFLKMYEPYYLCGLAAGAVTKTGKIGYIPACTIPEVVRHINAFVIGAVEGARKAYELGLKESPEVEVYVTPPLGFWVDPEKAKEAAVALIETRDCDTLAFTEDTPAVLEAAQEYYERWEAEEWGYPVYSFSHYSDMSEWGPNACLMGQIANWGPIYEDVLIRAYSGVWESKDYWWGFAEGAVSLGPISEVVPKEIRDYIELKKKEIAEGTFDPFTGPIRGWPAGEEPTPDRPELLETKIEAGRRATHDDLWLMNWWAEGVVEAPKPGLPPKE